MKRTCYRCKALLTWKSETVGSCQFGYKVKDIERKGSLGWLYLETVPLEECPKPMTNYALCKEQERMLIRDRMKE